MTQWGKSTLSPRLVTGIPSLGTYKLPFDLSIHAPLLQPPNAIKIARSVKASATIPRNVGWKETSNP